MYLDPKTDIAFKKIFGDEKRKRVLLSFLNAVLNYKDKIVDVTIPDPYQVPKLDGLKDTFLDVKAVDEKGKNYIIEMQVKPNKSFEKRALYYVSKAYSNQLDASEQYNQLKPVIFIGILDFNLFEGERYLTNHLIVNSDTKKQTITDFEFNFIELGKFKKGLNELNGIIEKWVYFFKEINHMEEAPTELNEVEEIKEAIDVLERHAWTREELDIYQKKKFAEEEQEIREKDNLEKGISQGIKQGLKEGIKQGMKEGIKEGKKQGLEEAKRKFAKKMKEQKINIMIISETTGLSIKDIEKL